MRPILAIIPALPVALVLPVAVIALVLGGFFSVRCRNWSPLIGALGVVFLVWLWSRGSITLHSYGLFLITGFFLSTWIACLEAKRRGYDPNIVLDAAMPLLLVSIVLCRILYFLVYPAQWQGFGEFLQIWNGGLSFHGAIIGALGTLAYFSWKRGVPFGTLCDFVAPGVFVGLAIGRIGCFMNGCCYGYPTNLPWAVRFPSEANRAILTPPSHPAQLYSTFMGLCIFAYMWKIRTKPAFNRFPGQLTLICLAFLACERFVMEIFRNGATGPSFDGLSWLTRAQVASICGLIAVAVLWVFAARSVSPLSTLKLNSEDVSTS